MGILLLLPYLALGVSQAILGFMGLEYLLGIWAAVVGVGLAFAFRFTVPMFIGTYFGAVNVMEWPWWVGLLVTAPGLVFIVPAFAASLFVRD